MHEIKCPNCGQAFTVDEAGFSAILEQVRTEEFSKEINNQTQAMKKQLSENYDKELKLRLAEAEQRRDKAVAERDAEMQKLRAQLESAKETYAAELKAGLSEAVSEKDREIGQLKLEKESLSARLAGADQKLAFELGKLENEKQREIERLSAQLRTSAAEAELRRVNDVRVVEQERDTQRAEYEAELKSQRELLEYYKDLKTRMSTKMIGETLEQHCETEFNKLRPTAFRTAYFEKDNDAAAGSKGDYIYRETDENGIEIISIMFEMKNEMDTTEKKHRNEHFFDKLDKDRRAKGCEYAVLVSMLEADSEYYNTGIVDVSHRYPKMYVIRPQFFITMITLLRNAALNAMEYKRELAAAREQNIDITNFEEKLFKFRDGFSKNYETASKKFGDAIAEIDKTIQHLEKVKENLLSTDRQLRLANDKAQDLTIKKLTYGNKTMSERFKALSASGNSAADE
ncbi:MAG: DUF2130 domain-containing protein [Ruminococcus sp.]|nr:DUF2130 domain-containing protein [Ruminococcus sp.]